jgi:signal transduction histidine kinase
MLIEAAADNQLMIDEKREIRFHVERQNFEMLRLAPVKADADLLEQAIMNILENAGKYSFDGTEVRIQVGLTKTGRFHITVANKGLPIRSDEVNECKNRGWRSGFALLTTGEGTGIGLWIVDNIMKAHGGELIISPTVEKITKVQLVFPISQ